MDFSFRHDLWWKRLPASPADRGRVVGLVVRTGEAGAGRRETPATIRVEPGIGVVGDSFARNPRAPRGAQVSLINVHVLRSLAGGEPSKAALAGDNLQVDLELSEQNLPVGTRLHVGGAVLEVSDVPHRPCHSFAERFGVLAARRVARANRMGRRGRGVLCRVVEAGEIRVGDGIEVRRPAGGAPAAAPAPPGA